MDSLTQLALGAAVGEATLGRKVGNRAMVWGAICGTLPDLDVFIPMGGAVRDFTYHRGASHSLLVLAVVAPLIVWLILKRHPGDREHRKRWLVLVYLAFATHVLLDSFTVYGTQIFWPVAMTPMTWSTIFIIDPLYTLPLLVGVVGALAITRESNVGHRLNTLGLVASTAYLGWSVVAKLHVEQVAASSLQHQGMDYQRLLTTPAPFNTLLWRVLIVDRNGYAEGFYSLFDPEPTIAMTHYPSYPSLLDGIREKWPVQRLQWFTKGFYSVTLRGEEVVMTDLRMGLEPDYVFAFSVGKTHNPHTLPLAPRRIPSDADFERLDGLWKRIWNPQADFNS